MLSHPQDASRYHHLLSVLARYAGHFAPGETRAMYKFAQNHCIRHINTGSQAWLEELFVLYQRLLKEEVLLEDGHLAHTDFKNIATAGLRMQAYDWVEDFIRQYREQVPPPYGESVYRYSLAACYFETGDLGQALRLLQEAEPADDHYQLSFRHLMAKIYFRQGAYETLFYQLDAFRRFLARNQGLGDTTRRSQEGFVHLLRRTARLAEQWPYLEGKKAHQRQARLSQKLSATEAVADRAWLESQIQDLGGYSSPP
ncbi:MAG: hypothetical protein D6722_21265 [Bacteroidetes bacterium]|nr:MAG: hypothetical protein D6722_21265 [Bacteroidota bacterium]